MLFYLFAPLLVRRSVNGHGCHACQRSCEFTFTFISGRITILGSTAFFPTELAFFLAGSIAFRLYCRLREKDIPRKLVVLGTAVFWFWCCVYQVLPGTNIHGIVLKQSISTFLAWAAIPLLFKECKDSRTDRYIGNMSYPVYIVHILVVTFLPGVMRGEGVIHCQSLLDIAASIALAALLVQLVSNPIEHLRQHQGTAAQRQSNDLPIRMYEEPPKIPAVVNDVKASIQRTKPSVHTKCSPP